MFILKPLRINLRRGFLLCEIKILICESGCVLKGGVYNGFIELTERRESMRFKIYYDKTLKMSPEKLASQVAHITLNLGYRGGYYEGYANIKEFCPRDQVVVVLGLSHKKFHEKLNSLRQQHCHTGKPSYHVQVDLGLTEVVEGTETAFGFIDH